jgi:hypothetical protein
MAFQIKCKTFTDNISVSHSLINIARATKIRKKIMDFDPLGNDGDPCHQLETEITGRKNVTVSKAPGDQVH